MRLATGNDACVFRLPFAVARERLFRRWPTDDLDSPWFDGFSLPRRGLGLNQRGDRQIAGDFQRGHLDKIGLASSRPFIDRAPSHNPHIRPRFLWKWPASSKPVVNSRRSSVIGGCGKTEIAEFMAQTTQQLTGFGDRLERIEGIFQTA